MKHIGIVLACVVGAYFVVRAIVHFVTIDYGDTASYEQDSGGPSLASGLAVHACLESSPRPRDLGARRLRRTTVR